MNSRTLGRLIAAPVMFVGVRLATNYFRLAPPGVRAVVEGLGAVMLGLVGLMMVAAIFVHLFPRLGARLFPWSAAVQRRARRLP